MEIPLIDTKLMAKAPFKVTIIKVDSPTLFWVHIKNTEPAFNELREELDWRIPRRKGDLTLWPSLVKVGEPVALFYEQHWERGLIEELSSLTSRVKVSLPDWGIAARWIESRDLYKLEDRFRDLNWQALACGLHQVGPGEGLTWWPQKTRQFCRALLENEQGTMKIRASLSPGNCLIQLSILGGGLNFWPFDIKMQLVRMGYVQATNTTELKVQPSVR